MQYGVVLFWGMKTFFCAILENPVTDVGQIEATLFASPLPKSMRVYMEEVN